MKKVSVIFEIIFVLCIVGLTLRLFGVERAEEFAPVLYAVGGGSFLISIFLRNMVKKQSTEA